MSWCFDMMLDSENRWRYWELCNYKKNSTKILCPSEQMLWKVHIQFGNLDGLKASSKRSNKLIKFGRVFISIHFGFWPQLRLIKKISKDVDILWADMFNHIWSMIMWICYNALFMLLWIIQKVWLKSDIVDTILLVCFLTTPPSLS